MVTLLLWCGVGAFQEGWGPEPTRQISGYVPVRNDSGEIFYWLFESRHDSDSAPLILWMTGGPGCSSELAIFYEQGPYRINGQKIESNPFAWNDFAHMLFVDQPVGTGFSIADDSRDYVSNEAEVAADMLEMLQGFFTKHPNYKNRDFYITGESYAGHYVPAVGGRVFRAIRSNEFGFKLKFKGMAIGNGMVNPSIQFQSYADYAFSKNLIGESLHDRLAKHDVPTCTEMLENQDRLARAYCENMVEDIQRHAGNFNIYDVRLPCSKPGLCYDFSPLDRLMARFDVQSSLGIKPQASWTECNMAVHHHLDSDWLLNCEQFLPEMLNAGIKLLVYAGKEDFICNWYGNRDWVEAMPWNGQSAYNSHKMQPWVFKGRTVGEIKSEGVLTFLAISNAGHMVPMDQPELALYMIKNFVQGRLE